MKFRTCDCLSTGIESPPFINPANAGRFTHGGGGVVASVRTGQKLHQAREVDQRLRSSLPGRNGSDLDPATQPYLDFLNDILDAVYAGKETFVREYILLRYYAERLQNYDPHFSGESLDDALADHGYTSIRISEFIEHKSIRIARAIEKYLVDKYTAADGQVE